MVRTILVNRGEERLAEQEAQYQFSREVLESIGLPLEDCFPESYELSDFTLNHKVKLREVLSKFGIIVLDDRDGGIKIYHEDDNKLIAEWKKVKFELREDLSAIDPRKKLYVAMHVNCWSVFDE